jgi:hypothetical protein
MLAILLTSCSTTKAVPDNIDIPTLEAVRPARPVLEPVTISEGTEIPPTMLRNYNAVVTYSLDLEDYAWGGETPGGLEHYIKDIASLYSIQRNL